MEADFVVDASGRQSKIDTWLQEIGYDPIPIEEVRWVLCYAPFRLTFATIQV